MKVLYVDQFAKTAGKDSLTLCREISKDEDVDVIAFLSDDVTVDTGKYDFEIVEGFSGAFTGNVLNKVANYLKSLNELVNYIKNNKVDIVHLQWFSLPWIEWLFVKRIKQYANVLITIHDVVPFDKHFGQMQSLNIIYNTADVLLVHTEDALKGLKQNYKIKKQIQVIGQSFCYKPDYQKIDKQEARKLLNIPNNVLVYLFYGTIRPSKGLDRLIKAFKNAYSKNKDIYLLVAGAPHKIDIEEYRRIINENLDATNSCISMEYVTDEMEKVYFSAADVLCLPYLELTQSGVAQVGLMYDLPLLATNVGAMSDVVENGVNGLLVDNNEEALAEAIISFADNKEKIPEFSRASSEIGVKKFSVESKASNVLRVYKDVYKNSREK